MPYIKVKTNRFDNYENDIEKCYKNIKNVKKDFSYIGSVLDLDVKSKSRIDSRIKEINNELNQIYYDFGKIENFLQQTEQSYKNADNKSNLMLLNIKNNEVRKSSAFQIAKRVFDKDFLKNITFSLGKFASIGNIAFMTKSSVANWFARADVNSPNVYPNNLSSGDGYGGGFSIGDAGGGGGGSMGGRGSDEDDYESSKKLETNPVYKFSDKFLSKMGLAGSLLSTSIPVATWLLNEDYREKYNQQSTIEKVNEALKTTKDGLDFSVDASKLSSDTNLLARFNNKGSQYLTGTQHEDYLLSQFFGLNKFNARKALGDNAVLSSGAKWYAGNVAEGFKTNIKNTFIKADGSLNKWGIAGVALDLGVKGIEHYEEVKSGKISADRAVIETVSETAVDLALGAGATAAISAGLVAAGVCATTAAVPVVAVTVAAGAVVMGANAIVEHFTGNDIAGNVGEFVGNTWDKGKEIASDIGNAIGDAWNKGTEALSDLGNKTKAFISNASWIPAWLK